MDSDDLWRLLKGAAKREKENRPYFLDRWMVLHFAKVLEHYLDS